MLSWRQACRHCCLWPAAPGVKPKKASGSKNTSAAQPPAKKKGSKASKHSEEETIEDDVVVDMDVDEEEGGSFRVDTCGKVACCTRLLREEDGSFEVNTCGNVCLLHKAPMRRMVGCSVCIEAAQGRQWALQWPPPHHPIRAWRRSSKSHTLSAGLLQCGCSSYVSLSGTFDSVSAVLSTCPAGVKHLHYELDLHGGVVQVQSPCL